MLKKAILDRFETHQMDTGQVQLSTVLRRNFIDFATVIDDSLPESREKEVVITHLEKALMFTTACIARNGIPKIDRF
jgi:hypothetical protein